MEQIAKTHPNERTQTEAVWLMMNFAWSVCNGCILLAQRSSTFSCFSVHLFIIN